MIETETRRAPGSLIPTSVNEESRTVEVVFTTFQDVNRGPYVERLDPNGLDLSKLVGAHVLNNHRQTSLDDVIGVVEEAWIEGGKGLARLKFSERAEPIWQDVKAGVLRNVSVGYTVSSWATSTQAGKPVKTAQTWTALEISFVALPADPGATVRNHLPPPENEVSMPQEVIETPEAPATPPVQSRAAINAEIRSLASTHGLPQSWIDTQIDSAATPDQFRAAALEELGRKPVVSNVRSPESDNPANLVRNLAGAIVSLDSGTEMPEQSREFAGIGLMGSVRVLMEARGERVTHLSNADVLTRAIGTSDLPNFLSSVINGTVQAAYQPVQSALKPLFAVKSATDFRAQDRLKIDSEGGFEKLTEQGEIKHTALMEAKESGALDTYAMGINLTRKAIINDQTRAITDQAKFIGKQAAEKEAAILATVFEATNTLSDNKAMYHADHGNLASVAGPFLAYDTGGDLDLSYLSAGRLAMRKQTSLNGTSLINVAAKYLVVPAELETEGELILEKLNSAKVSDSNPFASKLTLIVEPRLTSETAWYLMADTAQGSNFERLVLSGHEGPVIESDPAWTTLGMNFRSYFDMAAFAVDHRFAYKNAGA